MRPLSRWLPERSERDIESAARTVSFVVSTASLILMLGGLLDLGMQGYGFNLPGRPTVPLTLLVRLGGLPAGALAMSAGIILLALLPAIRVFLALGIYIRRRDRLDALIAIVVILELLVSMHIGRGA